MAKKENRSEVTMRCTVCNFERRPVSKNKKNTPERLEINSYCPKCRKKVVFKEKK
ncbi:MAG: 50S ribosomal protein L33 [Firmicutes bacterium]|nr:50S ribosomal protein L33 [Bacillota bacterium]